MIFRHPQKFGPPSAAFVIALFALSHGKAERIAYYQFDNQANPGLDSAGGDDVAVVNGGSWFSLGALAGAGAYYFDGVSPGLTIAPGQTSVDGDFSASSNFTIATWFRVDAAAGRQRFISSFPSWGFGLDFGTGTPRILMTAYGLEDKFFDAPDIVTGKWHHIAVTVDPDDGSGSGYTRIFLNGEEIGGDDGLYREPTGNVLIGNAGIEIFRGALDELAYYNEALSSGAIQSLYAEKAIDTDNDGMLDTWETAYGLNPGNPADASLDKDVDGLSNLSEYQMGLLPNDDDTDDDGLKDGVEDNTGIFASAAGTGTDPKRPDTDGDGLKDGDEVTIHSTDPNLVDSDGDLYPDGYEVLVAGSDPADDADPALVPDLIAEYRFELPSMPGFDSAGGDDSGTYVAGAHVSTGALAGRGAYSMTGSGQDGLGFNLGSAEVDPDLGFYENFAISLWFNMRAASARQRFMVGGTWGFGIDFNEATPRLLMTTYGVEDKFFQAPGVVAGKWHHAVVVVAPPDEMGTVYTKMYLDGVLLGEDDGPYTPGTRLFLGTGGAESFNGLVDEVTIWGIALDEEKIADLYEVGSSDADGDGMPATWELAYGFDPNDPADARVDSDEDGVLNVEEYNRGLLPRNKDTDGDGLWDGWEDEGGVYVSATKTGTNPRVADTDGDGIADGAEKAVTVEDLYATDPNKADTDGDGYPDGYEVAVLRTNPVDASDPNRPKGLIVHYDFEDAEKLGLDSAGGDDAATPNAGVYQVADGQAKVGNGAIYLSGADYLNIGAGSLLADFDLRATADFSAAAWFNFDAATGRQRILSSWPGWGVGVNYLENTPPGIIVTAYGVIDAYFPAELEAGRWHHVAFTVSPAQEGENPTVHVYLDGEILGANSFRFNPSTNFAIGTFSNDSNPFEAFAGYLDDIRYYNKELSAAEVSAVYLGTEPAGENDFRITSITRTAGLVTLAFPTESGLVYTIERSPSLTNWQVIGTFTATGAAGSFTEPSAPPAEFPHYYYRVKESQP